MEYVGDQALSDILMKSSENMFDPIQKSEQLIKTVKLLHSHRIAHLDLAPDNILISPQKQYGLAVIDFSFCAFHEELPFLRPLHSFAGHLNYASPEQLGLGTQNISYGADLYSLGLIIRELFGAQDHKTRNIADARDSRSRSFSVKMVASHLGWVTEGLLNPDSSVRLAAIQSF